ncbi:MAG: hypothetical protein AB7J30_03645 [Hyphomicrobium sp.]|uniref:hypothetical protein n=1 Tax=Hyphomicrobium sp. TaxID=82 RepID=UPI003D0A7BFE
MLQHRAAFARPCLALACVGAFAAEAAAAEYCVTCEGPPALYRCVVDGTEDGPGKDPSQSLYCISRMAAKGNHQTCAVSRGAPFPCPGLTALIGKPSQFPTLAAPPVGAPPTADAAAEAQPAGPPAPPESTAAAAPEVDGPAKVPRTVEELAGQTFKSSQQGVEAAGGFIGGTAQKAGEQIGNAGSAIGSAASKTWTCITSLFSTCGDDEAEASEAAGAPPQASPSPQHPAN